MARGRMISNEITRDKKINDLSSDTCRLAFTWLVTFADVEGRTYGDPAMLRSMLFPRRTDITFEMIQEFIIEWQDAGLVQWYEAGGDKWIAFPNFGKHQKLRKDRETPSSIPAPQHDNGGVTPELVRSNDGVTPVNIPVKLKEVKLNYNGSGGVSKAYEGNIGALTPMIAEELGELEKEYSPDWIVEAIEIAVQANVRKLSYIKGILRKWGTTGKDVDAPAYERPASEVY